MSDEKKKLNIKELLKNSIPIIIFIAIMGILTLILWPYIKELGTEEGREAFKAWVDTLGFGGWLITLGIQLLQIFVAFIPGEPVEIMLGYVWGPWLGTATCLLGIFIGRTENVAFRVILVRIKVFENSMHVDGMLSAVAFK